MFFIDGWAIAKLELYVYFKLFFGLLKLKDKRIL